MFSKLLVPALGLAAFLPAAAAQAQRADSDYGFDPGNWSLEIAASGSNDNSFTSTSIGAQGEIAYFFTDNLSLALRQDLAYNDAFGSNWNGTTSIAADWHFDLGKWQPYVGGAVGYTYGQNTQDTWIAAPEVGVKYFLNHTTFLDLRAQYQFFFDSGGGNTQFDDGKFLYSLALGIKW